MRPSLRSTASVIAAPISWSSSGETSGIAQGHVDLGADDGQRSAKLVGSVGHELPLRRESGVEPAEHAVERVGQLLQLVSGPVQVDALVQRGSRQSAGRAGDGVQRAEHAPGHQPGHAEHDDDHYGERHERAGPELAEGLLPQLVLGVVDENRKRDAVDGDVALHRAGIQSRHMGELEGFRGDAELLRHRRARLLGRDVQTVADQVVVGGDKDDASEQEQTPIPEGELQPDGQPAPDAVRRHGAAGSRPDRRVERRGCRNTHIL